MGMLFLKRIDKLCSILTGAVFSCFLYWGDSVKAIEYSKFIVTFIILANVFFAIAILAVFWHTSGEPTVLVASWFAFTTGELWALKDIKKEKIKKGSEAND